MYTLSGASVIKLQATLQKQIRGLDSRFCAIIFHGFFLVNNIVGSIFIFQLAKFIPKSFDEQLRSKPPNVFLVLIPRLVLLPASLPDFQLQIPLLQFRTAKPLLGRRWLRGNPSSGFTTPLLQRRAQRGSLFTTACQTPLVNDPRQPREEAVGGMMGRRGYFSYSYPGHAPCLSCRGPTPCLRVIFILKDIAMDRPIFTGLFYIAHFDTEIRCWNCAGTKGQECPAPKKETAFQEYHLLLAQDSHCIVVGRGELASQNMSALLKENETSRKYFW